MHMRDSAIDVQAHVLLGGSVESRDAALESTRSHGLLRHLFHFFASRYASRDGGHDCHVVFDVDGRLLQSQQTLGEFEARFFTPTSTGTLHRKA